MAEELNPASSRSGILIGQQPERPTGLQQFLHFVGGMIFGEKMLPIGRSKLGDKSVDIHIVQRPSQRSRRQAEQTVDIARQFKIAEMTRDHNLGTNVQDHLKDKLPVGDGIEVVPVCPMNLARGVSDFADHQDEMVPHSRGDGIDSLRSICGEDARQVFANERCSQSDPAME